MIHEDSQLVFRPDYHYKGKNIIVSLWKTHVLISIKIMSLRTDIPNDMEHFDQIMVKLDHSEFHSQRYKVRIRETLYICDVLYIWYRVPSARNKIDKNTSN